MPKKHSLQDFESTNLVATMKEDHSVTYENTQSLCVKFMILKKKGFKEKISIKQIQKPPIKYIINSVMY